jgi:hypothetical protein
MKTKVLLNAIALMSMGWTFSAQADCPFPKAPETIPDGSTAAEAEMIEAMRAFKAYNEDVKAFQACLDEETKSRSAGGSSMSFKTMQSKKLAAAVDELEGKAKKFNEQVRIFKARGG